MKYTILQSYGPAASSKLRDLINEYISRGWIPQGGVSSCISQGNELQLYQAMIKEN